MLKNLVGNYFFLNTKYLLNGYTRTINTNDEIIILIKVILIFFLLKYFTYIVNNIWEDKVVIILDPMNFMIKFVLYKFMLFKNIND